ncbi:ROP1 ENHANCER 1 [Hibiscus trionum]|uniref:ROP1 ENHANCER 1 n=1 Tax=Hibiscus trionum TaxID=183268 RepID=A0A9W7IUD4_HIBTR|nr:ROP1 ENHANCER 1 [Hibiscus trionum]
MSSRLYSITATKRDDQSLIQQKMATKKAEEREASQGHQGEATTPTEHRYGNIVLKSGPLFLSSKGIGWTSWKKRWFILTHTSLVFFRSDPNSVSQKGNEVNLTLGGIDLNNSGSVVVKADKKLITVQFNDGRDGRTFTLKAETLDDLYEWKAALENALAQAPSSANVTGQNGILRNDQADADDGSKESVNDKPVGSAIIGRPILLALEDVDGAPTFLEKALKYIEEYGYKVEGILRQAADVEDVERRIQEYEQGKTDFTSAEDGHVIADCVKYIIRELSSPAVPASCCNALLEACRTQRGSRVTAMRAAVLDTFPEPNRRLLQRILMMMQAVASHKNENLMSTSAVAACMAPLLLRPLLSGECEIETDFDVGADSSMQLLQAAAAANHAQTIVITLLEEYDHIFGEGSIASDLYTDTDETASGSEEEADDDESYDEDESYEDDDDATEGSDVSNDDDDDASETGSESGQSVTNDQDVDKDSGSSSSSSESSESGDDVKATKKLSDVKKSTELSQGIHDPTTLEDTPAQQNQTPRSQQSTAVRSGPGRRERRNAVWGRTAAKKNLSMETMDIPFEEEIEIETPGAEKSDLRNRLKEETESNAKHEASMEKRKKALQDRCLSLEKDVARLKEELQRERDKRTALESGLNSSQEPLVLSDKIDKKTKADLKDIAQAEADITNLKKKVEDLEVQLKQQLEKNSASVNDSCNRTNAAENDSKKSHASSNSKKSAKKAERSQDANEVLDKEKSHCSSQEVPSSDKGPGSGLGQYARNRERRRGTDISQ